MTPSERRMVYEALRILSNVLTKNDARDELKEKIESILKSDPFTAPKTIEKIDRVIREYSTAQLDWDDAMRGHGSNKTYYQSDCVCGRIVEGRFLDHDIYRYKCMQCGRQWHLYVPKDKSK